MDISGIFPPIPTPFNKGEEIDYAKLKDNVEKWNEIPFHGMQRTQRVSFIFIVTKNIMNT